MGALIEQAVAANSSLLVNCASKEYFGAVDLVSLSLPVVTSVFLENQNGKAKIVSFYTKKAHGAMARSIMQNRLNDRAELQDFNPGGYRYQPGRLDAGNLVFMCDAAV